ncbi:hypothetical protein NHX12_018375 [Muraenolepis orangiensis]|uniref:CCHC NOA-type domain-containing protein n=1 Tax=Muraenolepis orangiensis TaxID=630683 RepID=A0A9Q0EWP8_9TELE|nr:hypothetical protein NHX12_018375 [Muraenolepis orangiensis]
MENASIDTGCDVKIRSYNALNTLYHETQQEIAGLNTQLRKRDNVIGELKAKLVKYERISVNVEENEPVLIGPSKSLIESLCIEICKLKKRKNELEINASRQADTSQQEIQQLRVRLVESERELERVRSQPDRQKDQEIHKLRSRLEGKERDEATRAVLCNSLAEEAEQLRVQLGVTVRTCQELMGRLERGKTGGGSEEEMPRRQTSEEMTDASNLLSSNAMVCQLKEDNRQLKQRVAHVENLNAKWQRYDSGREDYVRVLCYRLREYRGQASPSTTATCSSSTKVAPGHGVLLLQQEIIRLNALLADKMDECARLGRETHETRRRDQERIQTLEQQVLIYTEDFRWERADRERAQERIQTLQDQLTCLQHELNIQDQGEEGLEAVPVCRVHIGHRISPRRHGQQFQRSGAEPSQQQPQQQQLPAIPMAMPSPVWLDQSELLCPRCQSKYSDADAVEYLKHCQECANL